MDGTTVEVTAPYEEFAQVKSAVEQLSGITIERAELALVPTSLAPLDNKASLQTLRLLDALEEVDDVSKVYSNADFPDEVLARYADE